LAVTLTCVNAIPDHATSARMFPQRRGGANSGSSGSGSNTPRANSNPPNIRSRSPNDHNLQGGPMRIGNNRANEKPVSGPPRKVSTNKKPRHEGFFPIDFTTIQPIAKESLNAQLKNVIDYFRKESLNEQQLKTLTKALVDWRPMKIMLR